MSENLRSCFKTKKIRRRFSQMERMNADQTIKNPRAFAGKFLSRAAIVIKFLR